MSETAGGGGRGAPEATASRLQGSAASHPGSHTRHTLHIARGQLERRALKLLGYVVLAYLTFRLLPGLEKALSSLEHVRWQWVALAVAIEILSETGFCVSWRAIVDPDDMLSRDGRGERMASRVAWLQLGGGMLVPGGTLSSVGVGAWILHRFGMPGEQIAERQFNLQFLNTGIDALALIVFGVGLAIGIFPGESHLLLTLLPAAIAAVGIGGVLLIARRGSAYAGRARASHPKVAASIATLAKGVEDTKHLLTHRDGLRAVLGATCYLGFDVLVLWSAFIAIGSHPAPTFAVVVMGYIIGALGGSIPLPAGAGSIGGMVGMLILYGVGHGPAVAAVVLYQAIGQLVPLIGGAIAYLLLRGKLGPLKGIAAEPSV
jgi:uncharacterized membrane protein YbhN (UPF0104 family)